MRRMSSTGFRPWSHWKRVGSTRCRLELPGLQVCQATLATYGIACWRADPPNTISRTVRVGCLCGALRIYSRACVVYSYVQLDKRPARAMFFSLHGNNERT